MALSVVKVNVTNKPTHTGDVAWTDITGAATGNLTADVPYLIIAEGQIGYSGQQPCGMRLVHGSTPFTESEAQLYVDSSPDCDETYRFVKIWTPSSAEALKLQYQAYGSGGTVSADNINIVAIPLDHVTVSQDYYSDEDAVSDALTTSFQDYAAVTFTPDTAGHNWLILAASRVDMATTASFHLECQLDWTGGITATAPYTRREPRHTSQAYMVNFQVVRELDAEEHTITLQARMNGTPTTGDDHLWSTIIAIDLDTIFEKYAFECNPGADLTNISTTPYGTEGATCSLTPDTASADVLVLGYWIHDTANNVTEVTTRLQQGSTDLNSGVTAAAQLLNECWDSTVRVPVTCTGVHTSVPASAQTYAMDISANRANSDTADNCIVAISLVALSTGQDLVKIQNETVRC